MSKRQKKRNSLLLYEFLVQTISKSLIEDDKKKSSTALKILRKHFKSGSEMYKEFRLMNALAKTTVSSPQVAASIIAEARTAVKSFDQVKLDREKSLAIHNINHMLNDDFFYDQHVAEYKTFSTIQTLVNEWLSADTDVGRVGSSEDKVMTHLLTEKTKVEDTTISEDSSGSVRLLMKVMTKKLNDKYKEVLSEQQRDIVKAYAYSDDGSAIKAKLTEVKKQIVESIETNKNSTENACLLEKLEKTAVLVESETLDCVDDDTVTRFMLYSKLRDELERKE